ncbi:MAG TPA: hypothetical protein VHT68_18975 [Pseudolabrys sp.]|jgi:hypothetical protein|nr:hypothetical protein [Pseudolabrys sp.]
MVWLLDGVPTIALHGMSLSFDYGGLEDVFLYIITPIAALAAGALARWRSENGGPDSPACSSVSRRYSGGLASSSSSSRS